MFPSFIPAKSFQWFLGADSYVVRRDFSACLRIGKCHSLHTDLACMSKCNNVLEIVTTGNLLFIDCVHLNLREYLLGYVVVKVVVR